MIWELVGLKEKSVTTGHDEGDSKRQVHGTKNLHKKAEISRAHNLTVHLKYL